MLTVLFAAPGLSRRSVVLGQYAGIAVLAGASALAALGLFAVPGQWVRLLGLLPLALGIRGLVRPADEDGPVGGVRSWLGVAGATIANGADNVGVYVPVFARSDPAGLAVYGLVFAVLVAVWCLAGWYLAGRRPVLALLDRAGRWLVPVVFIALGLWILLA